MLSKTICGQLMLIRHELSFEYLSLADENGHVRATVPSRPMAESCAWPSAKLASDLRYGESGPTSELPTSTQLYGSVAIGTDAGEATRKEDILEN
jgi:hypothetical protein